MNRNWSWQGWVAIALAGLALVVALGGRMSWGNQGQMMGMWPDRQAVQAQPAPQAQAAPQAPNASGGQSFGRGHRGMMGDGQGMSGMMGGRGDFRSGPMDRHGMPGMFGLFGMLFGLAKLVGLGLLAWLLLRLFTQRRNAAAAATPAPPLTPAGHDPRVE